MTIKILNTAYDIHYVSKSFADYGHNTITCCFSDDNGTYTESVTTSDTMLTDRMNDDDSEVEYAAQIDAAERVISTWIEKNTN